MRYGMQTAAVFMSNQCIKCSGLERRKMLLQKAGKMSILVLYKPADAVLYPAADTLQSNQRSHLYG